MTESTEPGIGDEQLPEDLQPGDDNPLAEALDPDAEETRDPDELGMQDTQEDTPGTYRTEGEVMRPDETTGVSEDDLDS